MKLIPEPIRRRAIREDVVLARKARHAVAPLKEKLLEWHQATSVLGARINRAEVRGEPAPELLEAIGALEADVSTTIHQWRASLEAVDVTGRVGDAEKSAKGILSALAYYRERLAGHAPPTAPR